MNDGCSRVREVISVLYFEDKKNVLFTLCKILSGIFVIGFIVLDTLYFSHLTYGTLILKNRNVIFLPRWPGVLMISISSTNIYLDVIF